MLQVTQKVDVICSAISIKEAMIMCPITTWICDGIKFENGVTFSLSYKQCVAIGELLGKLGFVNEIGENPLELIQDKKAKELEQSITEQCRTCPECPECPE